MGERQGALEALVSQARNPDRSFWKNRRVLLTGHTGFKGAWATLWLNALGAEVHGFALAPDTEPSLWKAVGGGLLAGEEIADLRDHARLAGFVDRVEPQVVVHMAAQSLVRPGFADPLGTIATNAMGTANLLESLRGCDGLQAVLVVTTDKVYANEDSGRNFVEEDALGGDDPYSASKAAAELLTRAYARSFFEPAGIRVATARAGNVIGGGDWSADRLVPDVWRATVSGEPLLLRDPQATRPWQHVVEPLRGYLLYLERLAVGGDVPCALNFGPHSGTATTVADVADAVAAGLGCDRPWIADERERPPERKLLSLDATLAESAIGWSPKFDCPTAIGWTVDWYARHLRGEDAGMLCLDEIGRYEALA